MPNPFEGENAMALLENPAAHSNGQSQIENLNIAVDPTDDSQNSTTNSILDDALAGNNQPPAEAPPPVNAAQTIGVAEHQEVVDKLNRKYDGLYDKFEHVRNQRDSMRDELAQIKELNVRLQNEILTRHSPVSPSQSPAPVDDEVDDTMGEGFTKNAARVAEKVVGTKTKAVEDSVAGLKETVENTQRMLVKDRQDRFVEQMTAIGLYDLVKQPKFVDFMNSNTAGGLLYVDIYEDARKKLDAQTIGNLVREFKQKNAAPVSTQNAPLPRQAPPVRPNNPEPNVGNPHAGKRIYKQSEINAISRKISSGKHAYSVEQLDKLIADIDTAQMDGRIIADV